MSITDNGYGNGFANSFAGGSINESVGNFNQRKAKTEKLVYWGESHDTYANDGGESKNKSQNVIDRAYAVVAGNNGATALYFPVLLRRQRMISDLAIREVFTSKMPKWLR